MKVRTLDLFTNLERLGLATLDVLPPIFIEGVPNVHPGVPNHVYSTTRVKHRVSFFNCRINNDNNNNNNSN